MSSGSSSSTKTSQKRDNFDPTSQDHVWKLWPSSHLNSWRVSDPHPHYKLFSGGSLVDNTSTKAHSTSHQLPAREMCLKAPRKCKEIPGGRPSKDLPTKTAKSASPALSIVYFSFRKYPNVVTTIDPFLGMVAGKGALPLVSPCFTQTAARFIQTEPLKFNGQYDIL